MHYRHCERSEAIHLWLTEETGLLRRFRLRSLSYGGQVAPCNDGEKWTDLPDGQISRHFPVQPHLKKYFA
jgi:hypothetical protein